MRAKAGGGEGYDLFISYSRADEAMASLLQRELQRFAKPAFRLRALRVFRDNDSLSANPALWDSIVGALGASRHLLVLASPEAAASQWVNREVEHWRSIRPPGDSLLLAVTRGEVVWDPTLGAFDARSSTALPPALLDAFAEEPRYVDLRGAESTRARGGKDPRIAAAVADLAAPLHGRPKDQLVGEDLRQHRRLLRLTRAAVTSLSVLLLLALVGGLIALGQRNRAQRAAADSEFRRLANASATAPTWGDSVALALTALAPADRAKRSQAAANQPLASALARGDLPVLSFVGQSPGQGSSGERQGVDAALDGSALAYVAANGDIAVWDLAVLALRTTIRSADLPGTAEQVGLSRDGSALVVLSYPATVEPTGQDVVAAAASIYDVTGPTATLRFSAELAVLSASALAFGPDDDTVLVMEEEGTLVVARRAGNRFVSARLGEVVPPSNASILISGFSLDGRRACSLGDQVLQVYEVLPPRVVATMPSPVTPNDVVGRQTSPLDPLHTGIGCVPEPCAANRSGIVGATSPDGWFRCYGPTGVDVTGVPDRHANLASVAYSGLVPFPAEGSTDAWHIRPFIHSTPLPLASLQNSEEILAALGGKARQAGLPGLRVVRAGEGTGLLTVDDDGLIQVWSLSTGYLTPDARWETGTTDLELRAVSGEFGLAGTRVFDVARSGSSVRTRLVSVEYGDELASWDRNRPPRVPDSTAEPIAMRLTTSTTLVEVLDDGTVVVHELGGGGTRELVVPVTSPVTPDQVDLTDGRLAIVDGDEARVIELGDGAVAARIPLDGEKCPGFILDENAFVDLADDGQSLAALRCRDAGNAILQVLRATDDPEGIETFELGSSNPTTVSLTNAAQVAAVAFSLGQINVLRDGTWIEPAALQAERAGHNSYQPGWAAIDPSGRLLVTRRDLADIELWSLDGPVVERVGRLAISEESEPPAFTGFTPSADRVTIAWGSSTHYSRATRTAVTTTWSFDRAFLTTLACRALPSELTDYAATSGVTTLPACAG